MQTNMSSPLMGKKKHFQKFGTFYKILFLIKSICFSRKYQMLTELFADWSKYLHCILAICFFSKRNT